MIDRRTGNLFGGTGRDNGRKGVSKFRNNPKGYYSVAFTDRYNDVTERDVELKEEYARDSISKYAHTPKDMISLKEKKTSQTMTALDTVYYVRVGKATIGKVSIRVHRRLSKVSLTIIYQEKSSNKRKGETRRRTY